MSTLNISILTSPSAWGGMEVHTVALARTLKANGHEVSIIEVGSDLYAQNRFELNEKIHVSTIDNVQSLKFPGIIDSLRIISKLYGDICIFPKGDVFAGSWQLDLIANLKFNHFITIEHKASLPMPPKSRRYHFGGLIPGIGFWWYRRKINFFLRSLWPHKIVCVSRNVERSLIDYNGFPQHKVTSVCNGIDPEIYRHRADYRISARLKWGIKKDALVFGTIGRFHLWKGFDVALKLFAKLTSTSFRPDLWFILVGRGPELENLKELIVELNIIEKVKLIDFTDKPWEIYPAFDVFLMPSRLEGLPLTLLEAMASGCCPIAMDVGGISEVITDPSLGWLVQPDDNNGFFDAMKLAAELDSDSLRDMGRKVREHIVKHFNAQRQFSALASVIESECSN